MAGDNDVDELAENKKFTCCKTRVSPYVVCVNCGNIFHKSCLERDFPHLICEKGDTRTKCCKLTSSDFIKKLDLNKYILEIEQLKKNLSDLQEKYELLENNNKLLMQNNELHQTNSKLLEEKLQNIQQNIPKNVNNNNIDKHGVPKINSYVSAVNQNLNRPAQDGTNRPLPAAASTLASATRAAQKVKSNENQIQLEQQQRRAMDHLIYIENDTAKPKSSDEDGFQKTQRRMRPKRIGTKQVTSEDEKSGFVGAERKAWIYLYRIKRHVTAEQVHTYIKNQPGFEAEKTQVRELPSEQDKLKCFVVTAPLARKDELYNPAFWPENVGIRRFNYGLFQKYKPAANFLS